MTLISCPEKIAPVNFLPKIKHLLKDFLYFLHQKFLLGMINQNSLIF